MDKLHAKLEELLKAVKAGKGVYPPVQGGVQPHPEPPKHPGDNKEAISTVKPGSNDTAYQAEGEPRVHQVKIKKYDHEKGMPETPVARPKASVKNMGSNDKPVRASRHKTSSSTPEHWTSGSNMAGPEHKVAARWVGKGESCSMSKNGQWSLKKD